MQSYYNIVKTSKKIVRSDIDSITSYRLNHYLNEFLFYEITFVILDIYLVNNNNIV
jgi:hypothetical protein